MSKIYIDEAGVTITQAVDNTGVYLDCREWDEQQFVTDAEARAVVEGLLRRMLGAPKGTRSTPEKADALFEWLSHVVPESVGCEEEMADAMLGRGR